MIKTKAIFQIFQLLFFTGCFLKKISQAFFFTFDPRAHISRQSVSEKNPAHLEISDYIPILIGCYGHSHDADLKKQKNVKNLPQRTLFAIFSNKIKKIEIGIAKYYIKFYI